MVKKTRNNDNINVEHAPSVIRQLLHLCYLMQQVSYSAAAVPVICIQIMYRYLPIILPIHKYIIYTDRAITDYTIIVRIELHPCRVYVFDRRRHLLCVFHSLFTSAAACSRSYTNFITICSCQYVFDSNKIWYTMQSNASGYLNSPNCVYTHTRNMVDTLLCITNNVYVPI